MKGFSSKVFKGIFIFCPTKITLSLILFILFKDSIGISQILPEGSLEKSVISLIKRADEALYLAKKEEGNSYEVDKETLRLVSYL